MNFFKVGQAAVLALGDRRDTHEAAHADICALFGLFRRLLQALGRKAALGLLAADIHLKQDILHDAQLLGLLVDGREQLERADRFDHRDLANDIFHLVALEVADKVQGRAVIGVLGELFRHLLLAVLAQHVDACGDGLEALDYLQLTAYDAVILDIMLPGVDGLSVLKKMRTAGDKTPVLLLTARGSVEDRVAGLDLGADDYLVKPFAFDELVARLRVLLRRSNGQVSNVLQCGGLEMDLNSRCVSRDGRELQLSAKEFAVLEYLLRNQGVVLARETIENHVWDYDFEGGSNVVDVYIRYLRKKVDDGFEKKLIQTVRGAGYVLKETL